ncbi:phosphoribosyltransferase family protein [Paenibacillus lautus]|uniref:phosphoribosyltransferase family protein n=1 Tax=Paenibacillus lautus TaxID=1401 RepID=UPI003D2C700C
MKTKTIQHYSSKLKVSNRYTYKVLGDLEVHIEVLDNPFGLPLESLFRMAARINKKRSFLFVSKLLGKHIPVIPEVSLLGGAALALLYQMHANGKLTLDIHEIMRALVDLNSAGETYKYMKSNLLELSEPTLFIGFAETATALGHSMYDVFNGPTKYIHTTRDEIVGTKPLLTFEEEHSHATAHRCYSSDPEFFHGDTPVVLVDDEITTGRTALNIIRDLQQKHPRTRYVVASLLDWRSNEDINRFAAMERELGISIHCLSLLKGRIKVEGAAPEVHGVDSLSLIPTHKVQVQHHYIGHAFSNIPMSSINSLREQNDKPYLELTGRFGLRSSDNKVLDHMISSAASLLKNHRVGKRTLCMGTGEFMYIPMRIASEMGQGILYQSSTRSPIHPSREATYGIQNAYSFHSPEDRNVDYYFYNIADGQYDEIFVFVERSDESSLYTYLNALRLTGIPVIHVVHFNVNNQDAAHNVLLEVET